MRVEWHLAISDWVEVADDGSLFGQARPPQGENVYEYLTWLCEQAKAGSMPAACAYSTLKARVDLMGDPFSHRHLVQSKQCGEPGCVERRPEPPWCCAQPMWLTGVGWRCRVTHQEFPFVLAVAL